MIPPSQDLSLPPDHLTTAKWKLQVARAFLSISALSCLGLTFCYSARPDACSAITVFPAWIWLVPGLMLSVLGFQRKEKRLFGLVIAAWMVFLMIETEEPLSLVRTRLPRKMQSNGESLRVVSLNCNIGSRLAAGEVAAYQPDIVLLQESPNRAEVEDLARRLFGNTAGIVHGVDASLIVRGRVLAVDLPLTQRGYFVQARVHLTSGREIEIISTRLVPAVFRVDLWSPDCWREQAENRRKRREQLRVIAQKVEASSVPVIVGGDFNAPQGDAVFRLLRPKLHDSFSEGGRGWGNTILNDYPMLRIDQIWVGDAFRSRAVVACKTRNSDHRMVICDLILQNESNPL